MSVARVLIVLICVSFGFQTAVQAQPVSNDQPRLSISMSDPPYIIGQPITLRVKILVPTWMPKPPIYPSFEQPGLMVRLPQRSTHPISETVSGQTWSGTSRRYTIYPLEQENYQIPGQKISFTYADENAQPVQVDLTTDPIKFRSTLPEGAKGMDPPVMVTTEFSLEQDLSRMDNMAVGDIVTRQVTARIQGTTAILIPPLIPAPAEVTTDESPADAPLLRTYPKDPVILEAETDGVLSGSRHEEITYMAQSGGAVVLPPIQIEWFNLATNTIETARLEGMSIQIARPTAPPMKRRTLILLTLAALAVLSLLAWLICLVWPKMQHGFRILENRWRRSEPYARRAVNQAIGSRDQSRLMVQLALWRHHHPNLSPRDLHEFDQGMARLGEKNYGADSVAEVNQNQKTPDTGQEWNAIARQFKVLCYKANKHAKRDETANILPNLNP
jgi:hypothetical protein